MQLRKSKFTSTILYNIKVLVQYRAPASPGWITQYHYRSVAYKSLSQIQAEKSRLPAAYKPNSNISWACIRVQSRPKSAIKISKSQQKIVEFKWSNLQRATMRAERVTSRAICTRIVWSKSSLSIYYFGQGTNHQEFSVSLQRGCQFAPL